MPERPVPLAPVASGLPGRQQLFCDCCTRGCATMAVFEPPNKLLIRAKVHGMWHHLTLVLALPPVPGSPAD